MYTPSDTTAYEELVGICARNAGAMPRDGPVAIAIYVNTRAQCDLDNYIKVILDGLNNIAYHDDRQVKQIIAIQNNNIDEEGIYVVICYINRTNLSDART